LSLFVSFTMPLFRDFCGAAGACQGPSKFHNGLKS
jgi:hypothetical protein